MPFTETLNHPRLAELDPMRASVVRERLWTSYLAEVPGAADKFAQLDDAGKRASRQRFDEGLAKYRPQVFRVVVDPEVKGTPTVMRGNLTAGTPTISGGRPARYRPLYDSKTEALLDAINTAKFDSNQLDDQSLEEMAPFMRANLRADAFESFISPLRERLLKQGVSAGTYALKAGIRGMAPTVVETALDKAISDPSDESYRKWKAAYGDISEGFGAAGAVGSLMGGGAAITRAVEKLAIRGGAKLTAELIGIGALDWAFADKLPGFSAELVDSELGKKALTVAEGMALGAAPGLIRRALGGAPTPRAAKVPEALKAAGKGLREAASKTALSEAQARLDEALGIGQPSKSAQQSAEAMAEYGIQPVKNSARESAEAFIVADAERKAGLSAGRVEQMDQRIADSQAAAARAQTGTGRRMAQPANLSERSIGGLRTRIGFNALGGPEVQSPGAGRAMPEADGPLSVRMSPQAQRMADKYGFVDPALLSQIGVPTIRAVIGGAIGYATGDNPEDSILRSILGAAAGGAASRRLLRAAGGLLPKVTPPRLRAIGDLSPGEELLSGGESFTVIGQSSGGMVTVADEAGKWLSVQAELPVQAAPKAAGKAEAPSPVKRPGEARQMAENALTPISTQLENISPELKFAERRHEFNMHQRSLAYRTRMEPFMKDGRKRMTKADAKTFNAAALNGDREVIDQLVSKYRLGEQYKAFRAGYDDLLKDARAAGFDVGKLDDYFSRKVKDVPKYMDYIHGANKGRWGEIDQALKAEEKRLGVDVLDMEAQAHVINNVLRGRQTSVALAKPGQLKERRVRVIEDEALPFYKQWHESTLDYVDAIVNATEKRRFFGKHMELPEGAMPFSTDSMDAVVQKSIGSLVAEQLRAGKILPHQQAQLGEILKGRMVQKPGRKWLRRLRNATYIDAMGSPVSAITQLQDFATSAYQNGYFNTAMAAFGKKAVGMKDIGLGKIAAEFGDHGKLAKTVDAVFTATGITRLDRLTKETFLNAAMTSARKAANATGPARNKLGKELAQMFGAEAPRVADDLANGRLNENVKFYLFNKLADVQPIALSEVPLTYLKHPNGRVFYALKTYTLRQLDLYRREAFREMANGNVGTGLKNLVKLSVPLLTAGVATDVIKDFMLNRKTEPSDMAISNLLRLVGVDKYAWFEYQRTDDPISTAAKIALPPTPGARALKRDVDKILAGAFAVRDAETFGSIPIVGKAWTWWFGANAERMDDKDRQIIRTR